MRRGENDLNETGRRRILFVDDEINVLEGVRRMLHSMRKEWDMVFVPGSDEALEALRLEPFDIIVTDMRMPGTSGAELLTKVVRLYPEIVRIVLSGQWDQEMAIQSARTAHQYLTKPCSADSLKTTLERTFALRQGLCGRSLKPLVSGLTALPSLPHMYRQLIEAVDSAAVSPGQIGAIVSQDMAMTAKVMQLANSGFFGVSRHIGSPTEAVTWLGVDTIRELVQTMGVFSEFQGPEPSGLLLLDLQRQSVETARIAQAIAKAEAVSKRMMDDAFLAGLLHDLGKLILIAKDAEMYDTALTIARTAKTGIEAVEREAFGASHSEVGSYLLWLWGLPENVTEAVAFHHRPGACGCGGMNAVLLVHVAEALADELQGAGSQLDESYLDSTGLAGRLPAWRAAARGPFEAGCTA